MNKNHSQAEVADPELRRHGGDRREPCLEGVLPQRGGRQGIGNEPGGADQCGSSFRWSCFAESLDARMREVATVIQGRCNRVPSCRARMLVTVSHRGETVKRTRVRSSADSLICVTPSLGLRRRRGKGVWKWPNGGQAVLVVSGLMHDYFNRCLQCPISLRQPCRCPPSGQKTHPSAPRRRLVFGPLSVFSPRQEEMTWENRERAWLELHSVVAGRF